MDDGAIDENYRWRSRFVGKDAKSFICVDFEVPRSAEYVKINGQDPNNTFESCQCITRLHLNHETENNYLGKKPQKEPIL